MIPAAKLLLGAYKAQQAWRNLPPEERQRIIAVARGVAPPGATAAGAPGDGEGAPPPPPQTPAERAQAAAALAAALARQQAPVLAQHAIRRASAHASLAGRVAGAIVRSQPKRPG